MQTQTFQYDTQKGRSRAFEEIEREELLGMVTSLRRELDDMVGEIHTVLSENVELKRRMESLRGNRASRNRLDDVYRYQEEIEELIRRHEDALSGRGRYQEGIRRESSCRHASSDNALLAKKMLMLMMIADLV